MDAFAKLPGLVFVKANKSYTGSHEGMWYRLAVGEGDRFVATVWPFPWCFEKTEDAQKTSADFPLTEAGMHEAEAWFEQQYDQDKKRWEEAKNFTIW